MDDVAWFIELKPAAESGEGMASTNDLEQDGPSAHNAVLDPAKVPNKLLE